MISRACAIPAVSMMKATEALKPLFTPFTAFAPCSLFYVCTFIAYTANNMEQSNQGS